jgi:hypothetical protein
MKPLLLFIVAVIPMLAKSQCDTVFKTNEDKFTNTKWVESSLQIFSNKDSIAFSVSIYEGKKAMDSYVRINWIALGQTLGCIDQGAHVTFLFSDNSTIKLNSVASFNCDAIAMVPLYTKGIGSGQFKEILKKLSIKKLAGVRIALVRTVFDYELTEEQSAHFMNVLSCAYQRL